MSHIYRIMKEPKHLRSAAGADRDRDHLPNATLPGTDRTRPDPWWRRWGPGPRSGARERGFSRSCGGSRVGYGLTRGFAGGVRRKGFGFARCRCFLCKTTGARGMHGQRMSWPFRRRVQRPAAHAHRVSFGRGVGSGCVPSAGAGPCRLLTGQTTRRLLAPGHLRLPIRARSYPPPLFRRAQRQPDHAHQTTPSDSCLRRRAFRPPIRARSYPPRALPAARRYIHRSGAVRMDGPGRLRGRTPGGGLDDQT